MAKYRISELPQTTELESGAIFPVVQSGQTKRIDFGSLKRALVGTTEGEIAAHPSRRDNPHKVTAKQVGADPAGSAQTVQDKLNTHAQDTSLHPAAESQKAWDAAANAAHSHQNQNLLDRITEERIAYWDGGGDGTGEGHFHQNQELLDSITEERVAVWDSGGGYCGRLALTIPASGWVEAEELSDDHHYVCDVEAADVTGDLVPVGTLVIGSFGIANTAGVVGGCETFDGYVRFYSKSVPEADLHACIDLFKEGGVSGGTGSVSIGSGLMYDQNGAIAVNIGEGLSFDENNALTVNTETVVTDDDLVNETEVMESVAEILNEESPAT